MTEAAQGTPPVALRTAQEGSEGQGGAEVGLEAPKGSAGLRATGKPKRDRKAQRSPALSLLLPRESVASRARALAEIAKDCAGRDDGTPPLPLAVACRLRGLPLRTVEDAIAAGRVPALEAARAAGVARALRQSMTDPANGRNWWQLAERLAPKELHLPTKVHTGQDPDAAPSESRVTIEVTDVRQLARGVVATVLPAGKKGLPP